MFSFRCFISFQFSLLQPWQLKKPGMSRRQEAGSWVRDGDKGCPTHGPAARMLFPGLLMLAPVPALPLTHNLTAENLSLSNVLLISHSPLLQLNSSPAQPCGRLVLALTHLQCYSLLICFKKSQIFFRPKMDRFYNRRTASELFCCAPFRAELRVRVHAIPLVNHLLQNTV